MRISTRPHPHKTAQPTCTVTHHAHTIDKHNVFHIFAYNTFHFRLEEQKRQTEAARASGEAHEQSEREALAKCGELEAKLRADKENLRYVSV